MPMLELESEIIDDKKRFKLNLLNKKQI